MTGEDNNKLSICKNRTEPEGGKLLKLLTISTIDKKQKLSTAKVS